MSCGVFTIAHGHPRFAQQAVALARSIRLRSPNAALAVATDLAPGCFEGMFDIIVPWSFTQRSGLTSKLDMFAMSPFDTTLFLDSDILVYVVIEEIFRHFAGADFSVIGQMQVETGWFESTPFIQQVFGAAQFPRFVGGLYYFAKSAVAENVFREASLLRDRYDELRIKLHDGRVNDEPLFSLAMVRAGLRPHRARTDTLLFNPTWRGAGHVDADVIAGQCIQWEQGRPVRRAMLHFYDGYTNTLMYAQEVLRLAHVFGDRNARLLEMRALVNWLMAPPRPVWRLLRWLRRRRQAWRD